MTRLRKIAFSLSILTASTFSVTSAQKNNEPPVVEKDSVSIVDIINGDTASTIKFIQPEGLNERLLNATGVEDEDAAKDEDVKKGKKITSTGKRVSYTIVAFNKPNQREKAMEIARIINTKFPQYRAKVTTNLPYWQVSVGPFFEEEDARKAMSNIRNAVPGTSPSLRKKNIVVTR